MPDSIYKKIISLEKATVLTLMDIFTNPKIVKVLQHYKYATKIRFHHLL